MPPPEDIESIRTSLGFTEREAALVRQAAPRLVPEVARWVDQFYARLVVDPVAMSLLRDEATVLHLKRSLNAWFHEMFSLPFDATYERTRAEIGRTHVRIGMPQHLMVTAMGGTRRDMADSVARAYAGDAETIRSVSHALGKVLDLELSLMLGQFLRRSQAVAHETDRALTTQRVVGQVAQAIRSAVDTALCYAELLRRAKSEAEQERWSTRLSEALTEIARFERRLDAALPDPDAQREGAPR